MSANTQSPAIEFNIQKIFTKDISFESPRAPVIFTQPWKPEVNIDLNTANALIDDKTYEVILSVTVTAKSNNEVAFVAEVKQSGIFVIDGMAAEQLQQVLGSFCPSTLFPYAREAIANVISRGGFPELQLAPVNFDLLYAQSQQGAKQ